MDILFTMVVTTILIFNIFLINTWVKYHRLYMEVRMIVKQNKNRSCQEYIDDIVADLEKHL